MMFIDTAKIFINLEKVEMVAFFRREKFNALWWSRWWRYGRGG